MANRAYLYNVEQPLLSPNLLEDPATAPGRWIQVADWARAIPAPWMLAFRRADATPYSYRREAEPDEDADDVTCTGLMLNTSRERAQQNLRDAAPLIEQMVGDPKRARRYLDAALAAFASLELPVVALYADELVDGDDARFLSALDGKPGSIPALEHWSAGFDCGFGPTPYAEDEDDDDDSEDEPGAASLRRGEEAFNAARGSEDLAEAARCFREAAEAGNGRAQVWMAIACYHGLGVERDRAAAAEWARRSAMEGETVGYYVYGLLCHWGEGTPKDLFEGGKCMRNAAGRDYAPAIAFLATPAWKFWARPAFPSRLD